MEGVQARENNYKTYLGLEIFTGAGTTDSSWMLNICPNFRAAPRILHNAIARRSAFFSDR